MKYLDPNGLAKLKQADDARLGRLYRSKATRSWSRTDKAGAVTCWPVGGTPLKPSVDFLFTETGPASGDKGPENPSTISGVSEVKVRRYNKNMFGAYAHAREGQTVTVNGVSFTYNQDGSLLVNGQASATVQRYLTNSAVPNSMYYLRTGETYILSCFSSSESDYPRLFFKCNNNNSYYYVSGLHQTQAISVTQNGYASIWIEVPSGTTVNNVLVRPQLEVGSSATPFEPSVMNVYTISLGSTYYGGSIDLATGVMTVTHTKATVTGSTTYSPTLGLVEKQDAYMLSFYPPSTRKQNQKPSEIGCDLLPVYFNSGNENRLVCSTNSNNIGICLLKSRLGLSDNLTFNDVKTAFSSFFTAHPMSIVYQLATPQTVQLTPTSISALTQSDKYTPRLNTIYTDASAVQVGYVKSPIREEFELQQAIVGQGGNI